MLHHSWRNPRSIVITAWTQCPSSCQWFVIVSAYNKALRKLSRSSNRYPSLLILMTWTMHSWFPFFNSLYCTWQQTFGRCSLLFFMFVFICSTLEFIVFITSTLNIDYKMWFVRPGSREPAIVELMGPLHRVGKIEWGPSVHGSLKHIILLDFWYKGTLLYIIILHWLLYSTLSWQVITDLKKQE